MRAILLLTLVVLAAVPPAAATAQSSEPTTRAEALRQAREKKQQALRPNAPDGLQRALNYVEDPPIFLIAKDGIYPKFGTLTTGSGIALGVGYRNRSIFQRYGYVDAFAAGSFKKYWATEARVTFPDLADGRLLLEARGSLREYPRESFFGVGPDSRREDRTSFLLRQSLVNGRAGVRIAPALMVGGGMGLLTPQTGEGTQSSVPPISALFDPSTAPGLGVRTDFLVSSAFVEVDYREPLNARRGGWYRLGVSDYNDRSGDVWSFRRTEIDLRQYIGFFDDRRVIALRGFLSTSSATDDSQGVPFFLMPHLGGNDTLRGFRNYRFRGPHALLLQAEYRWEAWSGLDAAFFYDAGEVGLRRSDLALKDLEHNYGFGFRFNTSNGVVMRVDAAFGSRDGKHLHIVFGGVF